jgi:ParB-like chromosome segregation protein Spo0J
MLKPAADLKPYERNARTHPPEQIARISDSLRRFGFVAPVLIDTDNVIVAGHGRLTAAYALWNAGVTIPRCPDGEVPVLIEANLTPQQRNAYRIADNKLAMLAHFDDDALVALLRDLTAAGFEAGALGFSDEELALLIVPETTDEEAAAALADGESMLGAAVDPYTLLNFSCLMTASQRDKALEILDRARTRLGLPSTGDALVALCRRYAA